MTSEEAKLLKENALGANMGESAYLRLMISQKPNDYPEIRRLLKDLINEVNRIGVNINQIAFNNNAGVPALCLRIAVRALPCEVTPPTTTVRLLLLLV